MTKLFISFSYKKGFGNCFLELLPKEIIGQPEILNLQKRIEKEQDLEEVIILNIIKLPLS